MSTQIGFTPPLPRTWKFELGGHAGTIEETITSDKIIYRWLSDVGQVELKFMESKTREPNEVVEAAAKSSQTRRAVLSMEKEVGFDELKHMPFTKIQVDGGHAVPFVTWRGVSPFAQSSGEGIRMNMVRYFLNGNRLRVRRDVTHEEVWYTLS
jgi:hypothetical protein